MMIADAINVSTAENAPTQMYRDCYAACRASGGTVDECMAHCAGLMPGDVVTQTPRGPCSGFWDCFSRGFQVPDSVTRIPGEIGGIVQQATAPLNVTLGLVAAVGLIYLFARR